MARIGIIPLGFLFFFVIVNCFRAETEVNSTNSNTSFDPKGSLPSNNTDSSVPKKSGSDSEIDSTKTGQGKKGEEQDGELQGESKNNHMMGNSTKQLDSKDGPKTGTNEDGSSKESQVEVHDRKEKPSEQPQTTTPLPKEESTDGVAVPSKKSRKEGFRGEECDSSNHCTDTKKQLVACLRVPGNDSPDLSLLIQNKGKGLLIVNISAPDFVQLEETTVQLEGKQNSKVKVAIGDGGNDTLITLTAGSGDCLLDFRDLTLHNLGRKIDHSTISKYANLLTQAPSAVYMSAGVLLLLVASACMFIRFRRTHIPSDGSKYQKLETELPISGGGKTEVEATDGWDNSWDDNWDDEEAPVTASKPVTPSVSSKGLASRRLNKEGRND
ncbi:uncharacterized protein LOC122082469 [Macadamia integrifolia]|uniref:uncharacterized protein LOC122082469 n=1 Tax=Macadamia integrifolia TaxID=60698 RepID=UPI001C4FF337|nr:uncharacterized protein LOC122082469 [Macadamia integrifolia]